MTHVFFLSLRWLGCQGSTENFWTFARASFFRGLGLVLGFYLFQQKNTRSEFLLILGSTVKSWLTYIVQFWP